jgi:hypothetical protein
MARWEGFVNDQDVEKCKAGAWTQVTFPIVQDRHNAASQALALALALYHKHGIEMVEHLFDEIDHAENYVEYCAEYCQ